MQAEEAWVRVKKRHRLAQRGWNIGLRLWRHAALVSGETSEDAGQAHCAILSWQRRMRQAEDAPWGQALAQELKNCALVLRREPRPRADICHSVEASGIVPVGE